MESEDIGSEEMEVIKVKEEKWIKFTIFVHEYSNLVYIVYHLWNLIILNKSMFLLLIN
jgi:predicted transcriptional regulator YdeE